MGDVKDAVKGSGTKRVRPANTPDAQNMLTQVRALADELSALIAVKDVDVESEGDTAKPENTRKAAVLRASHSLLVALQGLMEDY